MSEKGSSLDLDSESDSANYYEVEKILKRRGNSNGFEYLVKWENFPVSEATWEPEEHLDNVKWLIESFNLTLNKEKEDIKRKEERLKLELLAEKHRNKSIKRKKHERSEAVDVEIPKKHPKIKDEARTSSVGGAANDQGVKMVRGNLSLDVPVRILGCRRHGSTVEYAVMFKARRDCLVLPQAYSHQELKAQAPWLLSQYLLDCAVLDPSP